MDNSKVTIRLKVIAEIGDKRFESVLTQKDEIKINGLRVIDFTNLEDTLKKFVLRNCEDEEILTSLVQNDQDRKELVYNPFLSNKLADELVDELCHPDASGAYPYAFCVILGNPSVSQEKLDFYARTFLDEYQYSIEVNDGRQDYELIYLLRYIANNPSVGESTLELLKESDIPLVIDAINRK